MCPTPLLPLLGNEVEIRRDHSEQSIAEPSLFIEVLSTVACFLFSSVCLVWFVLHDGDCNLPRVTSLFPNCSSFLYLLMSIEFDLFSLFVGRCLDIKEFF